MLDTLHPVPVPCRNRTEQESHKVGLQERRIISPGPGGWACFSSTSAWCAGKPVAWDGVCPTCAVLQLSSPGQGARVPPGSGLGEAGEHSMDVGEKPGTRQPLLRCWA